MTGWLDYFVTGLETQMIEVRERGEQVIRCDVLVKQHGLNERQAKALGLLMKKGSTSPRSRSYVPAFPGALCKGTWQV